MRRGLALFVGLLIIAAGCIGSEETVTDEPTQTSSADVAPPDVVDLDASIGADLNFTTQLVDAAIGYEFDLYEPTMEVSPNGTIYVTGHTILVDTTGAPVFMSQDDGESWEQLPFAKSAKMPAGIHGATPPPSDEIFLVNGEDGRLWGVDITLATFPVNGWCNEGAEHCYHNPNAYDEAQAQTTRAEAASGMDSSCSLLNVNDRPWAAYGDGTLLMVNNPGGGPVQVGAMDVPRDTYLEGPGLGGPGPVSAEWNLCAGEGGGFIPGIPAMRDDGFFAVPQVQDDELVIIKGNADDVMDVEQVTAMENTNEEPDAEHTVNYGHAVFDEEGTLFVGARNNTEANADDGEGGQLQVAVSTDDGESFQTRTFQTKAPATSIYLDGNMNGPGALLSWAQEGDDGHDWYAAHLYVGPNGGPVVENVTVALDEGPPPSAHVQGAAAGPDGRSYLVMYNGGYSPVDRAQPLDVLVQQDGPTLPVG